MARTLKIIESQYLNNVVVNGVTTLGLLSLTNSYLAGLPDPIIRGWNLDARFIQKRQNIEWMFSLEWDSGGAALATPFTLRVDQSKSFSRLMTTINTFFSAYTGFPSTGIITKLDSDVQGYFKQYMIAHLLNATAGASANFLPL